MNDTNKTINTNKNINFNQQAGFLLKKRNQYIYILVFYFLLLFVLAIMNPFGITSKYLDYTILITIFFVLIMIIYLQYYTYAFSHQDELTVSNDDTPPIQNIAIRVLYIFLGLGISAAFIYWIINTIGVISSRNDFFSLILNIIIIIAILSLFFRVINAGNYFTKMPLVRLIVNSILYIPCLFSGLIDLFVKTPGLASASKKPGIQDVLYDRSSIITLLFTIGICVIYFMIPYILNRGALQGGKIFLDKPIHIDSKTDIASYEELNGKNENEDSSNFEYQYGLSFWFYLDQQTPSTNSSYSKYATILDYGNKPKIMYKGETNTLLIVVDEKDKNTTKDILKNSMYEFDDEGRRIIYKRENMLLQKWNNIIINYTGGTLDIFYNGELVKTSINVVPYMRYDTLTVGQEDGLKGGICNIVYFKSPLNINQVLNLYSKLKDKTPPSLYNWNQPFILQMS
jgi:hypothetical protein